MTGLDGYRSLYRDFDAPLMRELRADAYGEDIGQHSWVTATELRADAERLRLRRDARLLDLGAGPCGPLTFLAATTGCVGTGLDRAIEALEVGRERARRMGIASAITTIEGDLTGPLPFADGRFDAVVALDVVLHVPDRGACYREAARVLGPEGRLLVVDAGVVTGQIDSELLASRSAQGVNYLVPEGRNEALLASAGLTLLEREDRTSSVVTNAGGRLAAIARRRDELREHWGAEGVARQERYLEAVVALASSGGLSRIMYLAVPHHRK